jgi:hypothetical protein
MIRTFLVDLLDTLNKLDEVIVRSFLPIQVEMCRDFCQEEMI